MREYSWNTSGYNFKQDANKVGRELESLGDNLTAENIIELAKDTNTTLHKMFEWDDTLAAKKWRKHQATCIITSLKVTIIEEPKEKPKKVRAFVTTKKNTVYEPIEKIIKDTDKYALLLEKAYRELAYVKAKYETLVEIQELLKDIPEL